MSSKNILDAKSNNPVRRSRRWSLAGQLTVLYFLSSFAIVLLATGYLYSALANNLDRQNDRFLVDQALPLVKLLQDQPSDFDAVRRQVELSRSGWPDPSVYLRVLDDHGEVIASTPVMGLVIPKSDFPEPQPYDRNTVQGKTIRSAERWFRLLTVQTVPPPGQPSFIIQMGMDRSLEEGLLIDYHRNLLLVLGVALLVCSLGGYRLARRGIRPVRDMADTAGRIRLSTMNERIAVTDLPTELRTLAKTFNEMLDRLESSFARLSQFAADIAHELRTPINNLRGEAGVALSKARTPPEYQEILSSALEEYARLSRLIDSLLFLARAENPAYQIRREPLDLCQELERIREYYEAAAVEAGVRLTVACPQKVVGQLDRMLLQRAVGNLVSNALRHTPAQGSIALSVGKHNGCLQIEVADTGSGIPADHLSHVFDRFYRVDDARNPGTAGNVGLGLAIVKSIAELHGGSVAITSTVGAGTRVTLSFPQETR